mgnify:CR=1 FL=1
MKKVQDPTDNTSIKPLKRHVFTKVMQGRMITCREKISTIVFSPPIWRNKHNLFIHMLSPSIKPTLRRLITIIGAYFAENVSFAENKSYICRIICGE